jgi:phospholipid-binding lipoprotein MlaA
LALCAALLAAATPAAAADPFEAANRRIHDFNTMIQQHVLSPAAAFYNAQVPPDLRRRIGNAFANLGEPVIAASGLAAGDVGLAANALARFGINVTLGLGGIEDAASPRGYPRRPFGPADAACAWGVPRGPYLVLPLAGPSTVRDAAATLATSAVLIQALGSEVVGTWQAGDAFVGYAAIHRDLGEFDAMALDGYAAQRSAHLQRRALACRVDRAATPPGEEGVAAAP